MTKTRKELIDAVRTIVDECVSHHLCAECPFSLTEIPHYGDCAFDITKLKNHLRGWEEDDE